MGTNVRDTMTASIFASVFLAMTAPVPKVDAAEIRKQIESQWSDLLAEGRKSHAAIVKMTSRPKEVVAFFAEKLKPVILEKKRVQELLKDLGSEEIKDWKLAYDTFLYFDPRLHFDLKDLIDDSPNLIARQRLMAVCFNYDNADRLMDGIFSTEVKDEQTMTFRISRGNSSSSWQINRTSKNQSRPVWNRVVLAIDLLEHFATNESLAVIKTMTTGHPDAGPTIAAKEALKKWVVK